ncbi:Uncharacterised protein [Porphyromonas macacae]|uniref:DUF4372 domain-containing protein n=1 Tax=Porphyromonas macacae TaxID=28115 RepID=A0A379DL38_9PORP|nr:Uncharacterised protein [Porphyromonas macacae]
MNKGNHFLGQPLYSQVLSLLNKSAVLQCSRRHSGERYVKSFDAWTHLVVVMLYAVIHRFDSLREITASLQTDARKLGHPGICNISDRSTLSDANKRRPQAIFADIYRDICMPVTALSFRRTGEEIIKSHNG